MHLGAGAFERQRNQVHRKPDGGFGLLDLVQGDFEVAIGRDVLDISGVGKRRGREKEDDQKSSRADLPC